MYKNTRCKCVILVANIIWSSGHAIRSFPLDFSFLRHSCRRVFTVFVTAMKHDRFGRALGTLFGCQIVLSMHYKTVKESSLGAKVDYF